PFAAPSDFRAQENQTLNAARSAGAQFLNQRDNFPVRFAEPSSLFPRWLGMKKASSTAGLFELQLFANGAPASQNHATSSARSHPWQPSPRGILRPSLP